MLGVEDGLLTGTVDQPWGDICDGDETQDGAGDLRTAGHSRRRGDAGRRCEMGFADSEAVSRRHPQVAVRAQAMVANEGGLDHRLEVISPSTRLST
jgi:hypothetical protein